MTDEELIAQLRSWDGTPFDDDAEAAADRISAQAAEIERLDKACAEWAEVSQLNYQRAKAAEAKLTKAVEALRMIANIELTFLDECRDIARAALAEISSEAALNKGDQP